VSLSARFRSVHGPFDLLFLLPSLHLPAHPTPSAPRRPCFRRIAPQTMLLATCTAPLKTGRPSDSLQTFSPGTQPASTPVAVRASPTLLSALLYAQIRPVSMRVSVQGSTLTTVSLLPPRMHCPRARKRAHRVPGRIPPVSLFRPTTRFASRARSSSPLRALVSRSQHHPPRRRRQRPRAHRLKPRRLALQLLGSVGHPPIPPSHPTPGSSTAPTRSGCLKSTPT
jgi:hypothetical protein